MSELILSEVSRSCYPWDPDQTKILTFRKEPLCQCEANLIFVIMDCGQNLLELNEFCILAITEMTWIPSNKLP